jgi:oligopeptide/dipeptide ABC transporter ATP-binding protein
MRQRVMLAMALLCRPKILFADEPTTALDVTIQAEILELLADLQARHGTAVVLVTHSLAVAAQVADRIAVMYAGRIVETAPAAALFEHPAHPYTQALLASTPSLESDPDVALPSIRGQPPTPRERPPGCAFEPRCTIAVARCRDERPVLETLRTRGTGEHQAACFAAGGGEEPR